jgi:hypothetical protein
MSESKRAKKHELMCLRLATECRELAVDALEPELKDRFLQMAKTWANLAAEPRVLH